MVVQSENVRIFNAQGFLRLSDVYKPCSEYRQIPNKLNLQKDGLVDRGNSVAALKGNHGAVFRGNYERFLGETTRPAIGDLRPHVRGFTGGYWPA